MEVSDWYLRHLISNNGLQLKITLVKRFFFIKFYVRATMKVNHFCVNLTAREKGFNYNFGYKSFVVDLKVVALCIILGI